MATAVILILIQYRRWDPVLRLNAISCVVFSSGLSGVSAPYKQYRAAPVPCNATHLRSRAVTPPVFHTPPQQHAFLPVCRFFTLETALSVNVLEV